MKSKKKDKKASRRGGLGLVFGLGALVAIAVVMLMIGLNRYSGDDRWVYIPAGASTDDVRDSLKVELGSAEGMRVYLMWKMMGGDPSVTHGAYKVSDGQRSLSTARRLKNGAQSPIRLSWTNMRTMDQLAEKVGSVMEFTPAEFLAACREVLPASGFKEEQFPAAFFPDTYEFYWSASPEKVVERMLDYRNKFWTDERRQKAKSLGLTPVQVATLASIVEEESAKTDEHGKIARLYLNRLDRKMPLQADPTVKFAVGDFGLRRIKKEHLVKDSPYNTYRVTGLPPGPIRLSSKSTIERVLDAPKHSYLYMCAKADFSGRHEFATDYATHQANARRYQAELNKRNIK